MFCLSEVNADLAARRAFRARFGEVPGVVSSSHPPLEKMLDLFLRRSPKECLRSDQQIKKGQAGSSHRDRCVVEVMNSPSGRPKREVLQRSK